jgi:hypothetical protein
LESAREKTAEQEGHEVQGPGRSPSQQAAKPANVAADNAKGVLVVRCEISPEAAKQRAFDKLLTANGIQPSQRRSQMPQALNARPFALEETKQQAGEKKPETSPADGDEEIIAIEATATQIEATVASIEAQPDQFLSVSVSAGEEQLSLKKEQSLPSDHLARNQSSFGGRQQDSPLKDEGNAAGAIAQQPTAAQNRLDRASQQVENRRNLQNQLQAQQMNRPASQQRAMFVLRVVGGQRPPAAAAKARNNAEINALEQQPASPPAALPAKR